eukprot:CAMPEP_0183349142 /NCGR_PEP_ID=MMETSP0164_2-20130417/13422_1 /TAXON_ID=221442 /ORGANISM="Coccolithus pelagicus ssp braarudi, Strain PLY182g" /LENGTH=179 /DNA_ID=CAMNT_0025520823 /DNA_START=186 /DNA_END=722 /DNA_ORIENTATION=+
MAVSHLEDAGIFTSQDFIREEAAKIDVGRCRGVRKPWCSSVRWHGMWEAALPHTHVEGRGHRAARRAKPGYPEEMHAVASGSHASSQSIRSGVKIAMTVFELVTLALARLPPNTATKSRARAVLRELTPWLAPALAKSRAQSCAVGFVRVIPALVDATLFELVIAVWSCEVSVLRFQPE